MLLFYVFYKNLIISILELCLHSGGSMLYDPELNFNIKLKVFTSYMQVRVVILFSEIGLVGCGCAGVIV